MKQEEPPIEMIGQMGQEEALDERKNRQLSVATGLVID